MSNPSYKQLKRRLRGMKKFQEAVQYLGWSCKAVEGVEGAFIFGPALHCIVSTEGIQWATEEPKKKRKPKDGNKVLQKG